MGSVHGLAVNGERENDSVALLGASDQLVFVLNVIDAGRRDTNANDGVLVRVLMVINGEGKLEWKPRNNRTWLKRTCDPPTLSPSGCVSSNTNPSPSSLTDTLAAGKSSIILRCVFHSTTYH